MAVEMPVVSLATHRRRYDKLAAVLPHILSQTLPFDTLLVNVQDDLSDADFSKFKRLEDMDPRIHVSARPAKWRSFNKFLHAYREYPGRRILTCDDDILYPAGYFEALCRRQESDPDCIVCHEVNPMVLEGGRVRIVNSIDVKLGQREFGKYLTGCCLFPSGCFDNSEMAIDDYERFFELTEAVHDEIWLWTLSTLLGVQCVGLDWTYSFELDGCTLPPEETALCHINGNPDNIRKYEERLNQLYGGRLCAAMRGKPCTFRVNRGNLLAVTGNMQWINALFRNLDVVFECDPAEVNRSMLVNLANSVNRFRWFGGLTVDHPLVKGDRNG